MQQDNVLAIDLAKASFHTHLATAQGRVLATKKLSRVKLSAYVAQTKAAMVAMEACGSAHYWARHFQSLGHEVRLIAPQFVKPFVKANKNDFNDAEGIAEAASRDNMRFVPIKSVAQQDMNSLHRIRSRLVGNRTALTNQMRGLLAEYGIVIAKGHSHLKIFMSTLDPGQPTLPGDLSAAMASEIRELFTEFQQLDKRITVLDQKVQAACMQDERCVELTKIVGVGPLTATALIAVSGNMSHFKNGRQFSAFLGLVPRQNSTGGKTRLQGISKRGDTYVRTLLIHGARAALVSAHKRKDYRSQWVTTLKEKKGMNRAAVALANRNARTAYALLSRGTSFDLKHPNRQKGAANA